MYRPPYPSQITWARLDEVESDNDSSIEGTIEGRESEESGQSDVEFDNYNPCGDPANSMVVINTIDMLAADLCDVAEISGRLNRVVPDYYGQV